MAKDSCEGQVRGQAGYRGFVGSHSGMQAEQFKPTLCLGGSPAMHSLPSMCSTCIYEPPK